MGELLHGITDEEYPGKKKGWKATTQGWKGTKSETAPPLILKKTAEPPRFSALVTAMINRNRKGVRQ